MPARVGRFVARERDEICASAPPQKSDAAPDLLSIYLRIAEIDQRDVGTEERGDFDGGRLPCRSCDGMSGLFELRAKRLEFVVRRSFNGLSRRARSASSVAEAQTGNSSRLSR